MFTRRGRGGEKLLAPLGLVVPSYGNEAGAPGSTFTTARFYRDQSEPHCANPITLHIVVSRDAESAASPQHSGASSPSTAAYFHPLTAATGIALSSIRGRPVVLYNRPPHWYTVWLTQVVVLSSRRVQAIPRGTPLRLADPFCIHTGSKTTESMAGSTITPLSLFGRMYLSYIT